MINEVFAVVSSAWPPPSLRHCDCLTTNGQCVLIGIDECSFNPRGNIIRCTGKIDGSQSKRVYRHVDYRILAKSSASDSDILFLQEPVFILIANTLIYCMNEWYLWNWKINVNIEVEILRSRYISYCSVRFISWKYITQFAWISCNSCENYFHTFEVASAIFFPNFIVKMFHHWWRCLIIPINIFWYVDQKDLSNTILREKSEHYRTIEIFEILLNISV